VNVAAARVVVLDVSQTQKRRKSNGTECLHYS
jgi:hypothetical protein